MNLYKILLSSLLVIICGYHLSAQRGIHSEAYGKSVFWKKGNTHFQTLKKSMSPSGIYSKAIGRTVFIVNSESTKGESLRSSTPPSLSFTNANLDWSAIHKDESLPLLKDILPQINSEITGYELILEENLLLEDRVIELFRTGSNFGSYIRCTSLDTGNKLWEQSFNLTNDQRIEIDVSMYTRTDGNIEVTGMRLLSPQIPNIFPFGLATRKVIDANTGELLKREYASVEDGGVICNNPNGQFGRTLPIAEDSKYLTSCSYPSVDGQFIQVQMSMDENGKLIDTIGYIENLLDGENIESHKFIESYRLPNNNIIIGSSSTSNPTDPEVTFSEIIILSPEGELINRINVSEYLNYATFFDLKVEGEHILISSLSYDDFSDPNTYNNHILILNQNGEINLGLNKFTELDGEAVKNVKIATLENGKFLLFSNEEDHCLKYFLLETNGSVKHLKSICLEDDNWVSTPINIIVSSEGDILTNGSWKLKEEEVENSFNGTFKMPLSELGISTSTIDSDDIKTPLLQVYPNPASSELTIDLTENASGLLQVYNSLGILMIQHNLKNQKAFTFSISSLEEGIFNIVWRDSNHLKTTSFLKIGQN